MFVVELFVMIPAVILFYVPIGSSMCRYGSLRYSPLLISLDGVSRFAIELMVLMHCYIRSGKYVLKVCQITIALFSRK